MPHDTNALEAALARVASLEGADLRARLQWLEDAAGAALKADLGERGARAALDLRAALGAVVQFTRGPMDEGALLELEVLLRTLVARALHTLYQALEEHYRELARRGPRRAECQEMAEAFRALHRAVARGEPPPQATLERVERVRASIQGP